MNMNKLIKKTDFIVVGEKTTICLITMYNGFEVVGVSSCVKENNFNLNLGRRLAEEDARRKVNQLIGFKRQDQFFLSDEELPF